MELEGLTSVYYLTTDDTQRVVNQLLIQWSSLFLSSAPLRSVPCLSVFYAGFLCQCSSHSSVGIEPRDLIPTPSMWMSLVKFSSAEELKGH